MDLRQLTYFVTVVHEGSVSRAAQTLTMTQPPLSTVIAQLEKELGVRLLDRHPRGVSPTAAGSYLAKAATNLLTGVEDMKARTHAIGTGRLGKLRIATSSAIDWEVLPGLLTVFDRMSDGVQFELDSAIESEVLDHVRDRRADVGVVYCARTSHLDRLGGSDLETAVIRREPLVAILPQGSGTGQDSDAGTAIAISTLAERTWLLPASSTAFPSLADHVRQSWEQAGITPAVQRTVADLHTIVRLVCSGMGVALVPSAVRALEVPGLRIHRLAQPLTPVEAAVVWRRTERPSPVLSRFLRAALSTREPDRLAPEHGRLLPDVPGPDDDQ